MAMIGDRRPSCENSSKLQMVQGSRWGPNEDSPAAEMYRYQSWLEFSRSKEWYLVESRVNVTVFIPVSCK